LPIQLHNNDIHQSVGQVAGVAGFCSCIERRPQALPDSRKQESVRHCISTIFEAGNKGLRAIATRALNQVGHIGVGGTNTETVEVRPIAICGVADEADMKSVVYMPSMTACCIESVI
jgi:hypothetical protein